MFCYYIRNIFSWCCNYFHLKQFSCSILYSKHIKDYLNSLWNYYYSKTFVFLPSFKEYIVCITPTGWLFKSTILPNNGLELHILGRPRAENTLVLYISIMQKAVNWFNAKAYPKWWNIHPHIGHRHRCPHT